MQVFLKRALTALVLTTAFVLAGCSSVRLVDSDVTAFSTWGGPPPGPQTPYRFERLPSQQVVGSPQDALEAAAQTSLAKVGMVLSPTVARYSVQVMLNMQAVDRALYDGFGGFGGYGGFGGGFGSGVFLGGGSRGASVGVSVPLSFGEPPFYKRELTVMMRDLRTNSVVFETRALHEGVWSDTAAVLPAMLDSALLGFPQPPPGTRRINVEIPR